MCDVQLKTLLRKKFSTFLYERVHRFGTTCEAQEGFCCELNTFFFICFVVRRMYELSKLC